MKILVQHRRSGALEVREVPAPAVRADSLLVRAVYSLISAGTEGASVSMSKRSLVEKARARPDLVQQVVRKAQRDGVAAAYRAVTNRLDAWEPLGYSLAGEVLAVGPGGPAIPVGALVACAGAAHAHHSEVVAVPRNLVAPVPEGVPAAAAAYTTIGAIALQGVRQAEATIGAAVAVIGLGLVGQLAAQILRAGGCRVLGIDPDPARRALAERLGATAADPGDAAAIAREIGRGRGMDAVLITAATASSAPVEQAADLARDRATVVIVGAVGLQIPREPYYRKELQLRLSRSYGPGRYDPSYEERGVDYPVGYVRWTEQRNMEAFLDLVRAGAVQVDALTTHTFEFEDAPRAYELITAKAEPFLGVLLRYRADAEPTRRVELRAAPPVTGAVGVGLIGAGSFAQSTLLPAVRAERVVLRGVATATGHTARTVADRFGFAFAASDAAEVHGDPEAQAVIVATRHDSHAPLAAAALRAGKAVYVEKPLAVSEAQLEELLAASPDGRFMTGYNRRFAPLAVRLRAAVQPRRSPLVIAYRVSAGPLPAEHWVHDPVEGGGRVMGEVCHFLDFVQFLADAPIVEVRAVAAPPPADRPPDDVVLQVAMADGSVASIVYASDGDPTFPKERVELFGQGVAAVLDDFRTLEIVRGGRRERHSARGEKGHRESVAAFLASVRAGGPMPISIEHQVAAARGTILAIESLTDGLPRRVPALEASRGE